MISLPPFKLVLPKGLGLEFLKASLSVWSLTSEMGAETPDLVPRSKPSYCSGTEATQLRAPPPPPPPTWTMSRFLSVSQDLQLIGDTS